MSKSQKKEIKRLVEALRALKWDVVDTGSGHYRARAPQKHIPQIIIPKTPSEYRAIKNLKSVLRRHGVFV